MTKAPAVECPNCRAYLSVTDSFCWRCGSVFGGRTLYEEYEREGGE